MKSKYNYSGFNYSGFNPKKSYEDTDGKYQESFTMMKKVWNVNDSEGLLRMMKVNTQYCLSISRIEKMNQEQEATRSTLIF